MKFSTVLTTVGSAVVVSAQSAPTAKVANGTLQGAKCASTDVNSFLGIPFAQPPLGDLRLAPPQPYNQTYSTKNATQAPPACIQFDPSFAEAGPQSEDCLFINVWTPANATADSKLPVKVWLYGGGNVAGGISNPTYDGCTASTSVIQVSINYRLGPLGFLSLKSLNLNGNQGTQDQLLGLQWVKENVAAFGGDPSKVMLFGQSAGASDTFVISSLPQAKSLISAAIMESGAGDTLATQADVQNSTEAYIRGLDCSTTDIACVRNASLSAINASYTATTAELSSPLGYVVDGTVIPDQPLSAGLKVPAVAGSATDEGTLFILLVYTTRVLQLNATDYDEFLTVTYGSLAQRVNETYPLSRYAGALQPVVSAMSAVITDADFRCPTYRFVRQASLAGMPVWTYSFNHTLTCPWYPTIPSYLLTLLGSTHTSEIPFVFAGVDDMPRPNGNCSLTAGEKALSATMLGAWDNMAANADPGSDWPRYDTTSSMGINVVGDDFTAGVVDYSICDFWDEIANATSTGGANGTATGSGTGATVTTSGAAAQVGLGQLPVINAAAGVILAWLLVHLA